MQEHHRERISGASARSPKKPSLNGFLALLAGLLPARGSGAPKTAPGSLLALLAALTALLCLACSPAAQAEIYHPFVESINGEGAPAGAFREPGGLAVDDSSSTSAGDVYVSVNEGHTRVVDKFSAAPGSAFLCEITGEASMTAPLTDCANVNKVSSAGVPSGTFEPNHVAVDPVSGVVSFAFGSGAAVVDQFSAAGAFEREIPGFSFPEAIAVDGSGDVFVTNGATVQKYDAATKTVSTFTEGPEGGFGDADGLAVDDASDDVYVADESHKVVDEFNAAGELQSQLIEPPGGFQVPSSVAVDQSTGDLYVGDKEAGVVDQFSAAGAFLGQIRGAQTAAGAMRPFAVAVSGSGEVYVLDVNEVQGAHRHLVDAFGPGEVVPGVTTGAATEVTPTSATLNGSVEAAGDALSDCHFDYGTTTSYGQVAPCEPAAASIPSSGKQAVTAHVTGLESGVTYHFRLQAANKANGVANYGADETFFTLPKPTIDSATVSNLTASSAVLNAKIGPNGYQLSECYFEYGTGTSYGHTQPCTPAAAEIPADSGEHSVSAAIPLEGANKTYHWRVIASSVNGTTTSSDHTFVYDTSGEGLPDGRGYEMVSPPQKNGALLGAVAVGAEPDVAGSGDRMIAAAIQCFAGAEACNAQESNGIGSPYEFTRTSSGWIATALAPSVKQLSRATPWYYSAEAGTALFSGPPEPSSQDDLYGRQEDGELTHIGPVSPPADGPLGADGGHPNGSHQAMSEDLSHVVWELNRESSDGIGIWPFDATTGGFTVYEYAPGVETEPLLVGVGGENDPGTRDLISICGTRLGRISSSEPPGMMSADGRIVYFAVQGGSRCAGSGAYEHTPVPVEEVFARVDGESGDAHTVAISEPQAPQAGHIATDEGCTSAECIKNTESPASPAVNPNWRGARFEGASSDGSVAVFTSAQQLTDEASEGSSNLYLYGFGATAGRRLVDVSAGDLSGGGPRVQGVMAVSADGSHVYFVAQGVLSAAANGQGQTAQDGADNLYVYAGGHVTFVAVLPESDYEEWGGDSPPVNVTPDGRFLVFRSHGQLTRDDTSISGADQIFRYDAETNVLERISIGNDGFNDDGNRSTATPCGGAYCSEDASLASGPQRRDLSMSDDGSFVFFQSPLALTPHALEDVQIGTAGENSVQETTSEPTYAQNVYEWHENHVYLISDGRDVSKNNGAPARLCIRQHGDSSVCLLGSDSTGANVFFSTADQLVPQDTDTELDYYDARIGGGFPAPASTPPCLGEACHGIPAATPSLLAPGSASFNGQGNILPAAVKKPLTRAQKLANALRTCRKDKKKAKRRSCEASAHKKYGAVKKKAKAKKSSTDRRVSR